MRAIAGSCLPGCELVPAVLANPCDGNVRTHGAVWCNVVLYMAMWCSVVHYFNLAVFKCMTNFFRVGKKVQEQPEQTGNK